MYQKDSAKNINTGSVIFQHWLSTPGPMAVHPRMWVQYPLSGLVLCTSVWL